MAKFLRWSGVAFALAAGCSSKNPPPPSQGFAPTANTTVPGGTVSYSSFTIPAGVTVTVSADAVFQISGAVSIAGILTGDCVGIDLEGQAAISITGTIDNHCSAAGSKDLIINTTLSGGIQVGAAGAPATLTTTGNFGMSDAPALKTTDFDVLPSQRPATPIAPACAAGAAPLSATATAASPAPIHFSGAGASTNGGALAYQWDFGDASSAATQEADHSYLPGNYQAVLTVTGSDGKTCASKIDVVVNDGDGDGGSDFPPAISIEGTGLVGSAGEAVALDANLLSSSATVAVTWDYGDGTQGAGVATTHTYSASGLYLVTETATDASNRSSTATANIYIYPAASAASPRHTQAASSCSDPDFNAVLKSTAPIAPSAGANGNQIGLLYKGDLVIGAETSLQAQNGADGASDNSPGEAHGQHGGEGGRLEVATSGSLTLCDGAQIRGASGGAGGSATTNPGTVAQGNFGGNVGPILLKGAAGVTAGASVTAMIGVGGRGGDALAVSPVNPSTCAPQNKTIWAIAESGAGGSIGGLAFAFDLPPGISVSGGPAGRGGDASATGSAGAPANSCGIDAAAANGYGAIANSSGGGDILLDKSTGAADIQPGAGGNAKATGGRGGDAETNEVPDCTSTSALGGAGGFAESTCDGSGRFAYTSANDTGNPPCNAVSTAGAGGNAVSIAGSCSQCQDGAPTPGNAVVTGGAGGAAFVAIHDDADNSAASISTSGNGGNATATGGSGGDCTICPEGPGPSGGRATSTGGAAGVATVSSGLRAGTLVQGTGGNASSTGGTGGNGASCCLATPVAGGEGGFGGVAQATAGTGGHDSGLPGSGGFGGDGNGPGLGGTGGAGEGTPNAIINGTDGTPGNACPGTETTCSPGVPTLQALANSANSCTAFIRTDTPLSTAPCNLPTTIQIQTYSVGTGSKARRDTTYTLIGTVSVSALPYDTYNNYTVSIPDNQQVVFTAEGFTDAGVGSGPSAYSSPIEIYPLPPAPTNFTATATSTTAASFSWTPPDTGNGQPIAYYNLYVQQSGSFVTTGGTFATNSGTISNLTPGATYQFALSSSLADLQESALSNSATVTLYSPPGAPQSLQATPGDHSVLVNWSAPQSMGSSAISGYILDRNPSASANGLPDEQTYFPGTGTSYTVPFASADAGPQVFAAYAENSYGSGPLSGTASATPLFPPSGLSFFNVDQGTRELGLSWSAPQNIGISPVDYYEVSVTDSADGGVAITDYDGGLQLLVGSLNDGDFYTLGVRAHNQDGFGAASSNGGTPAAWNGMSQPQSNPVDGQGAALAQGGVVLAGGTQFQLPTSAVYYAPILFDGTLNPTWTTLPSLSVPLSGQATASWQGAGGTPVEVIVAGGQTTSDGSTVHDYDGVSRLVIPAAPSSTGSWSSTGSALPSPRHDQAVAISGSYIYMIGGNSMTLPNGDPGTGPLTDVLYATINSDGTLPATSTWTATTPLPSARFASAAVVVNSRLYVIGGEIAVNGDALTDVLYAAINSDGSLGAWTASTVLPSTLCYATAQSDGNFLFVLGGINPATGFTVSSQLLRGTINPATGSSGAWTVDPAPFLTATFYAPSLYSDRYIYIFNPTAPFFGRTDATGGFVGP